MTIVVQQQAGSLSSLISGNAWLEVIDDSQAFPCNQGNLNTGRINVDTERYVDFTPSKAGNMQGVILGLTYLGDSPTDTASWTVKLQENTGSWVDRLSVTLNITDLVPSGEKRYLVGLVDFRFASTYAVTAVAATWRLAISGTGGSSTPDVIFSENGSDEDHIFHIPYLSSTQTLGASDAVVVTDQITIDQDWTVGAHDSQNGTQTGLDATNRYWSIYGCTPIVTPGSETEPQLYIPSTLSSNIDLEFEGTVFCSSFEGVLLIGEDESNPISASYDVDIYWSGTGVSTKRGGVLCNGRFPSPDANVQIYSTPPTIIAANLSETATNGTPTVKVTGDVTTEWAIGDKLMIAGGQDGATVYRDYAKCEYAEIQSLSESGGVTTITLTANLDYDHAFDADIQVPVVLCRRNVVLRGVYTTNTSYMLAFVLDGGWTRFVGVGFDSLDSINMLNLTTDYYTTARLAAIEVKHDYCNYHNLRYGVLMEYCHPSDIIISNCTASDARVSSGAVVLTNTCNLQNCYVSGQILNNYFIGRRNYPLNLNRCRNFVVDGNYFIGISGVRCILNTVETQITDNVFYKCRYAVYFDGAINIYVGQNYYRDIYYNENDPSYIGGVYYFDSNSVSIGLETEDEDIDRVGHVVYVSDTACMASIVIDNAAIGTVDEAVVSEVNRSEWVPGSMIAFVNYDEVAGQTKTWTPDGYHESTGTGLDDTEAHTTGAGRLAWRMKPYYTDSGYSIQFSIPADVANKPITVHAWCKLDSLNYAAGTYVAPRLRLRGLGGGTVDSYAVVTTTAWQLVTATILPTQRGRIVASFYVKTDAAGSDAHVYWDDVFIAYQDPIDLGGLDLQFDGQFAQTPITQSLVPSQVWAEPIADNDVAGSFGEFFQLMLDAAMSTRATPAQVNAECDTALADYDGPTKAELDSGLAGLNDLSVADIQSALDAQGLTTARAALLDNLDQSVATVAAAIAALNDIDQSGVQAALTAQGYTTGRAALLDNMDATVSAVLDSLVIARALLHDNAVLDDQTHDGDGRLTEAHLYCYDSKANADTHDKSTGLVNHFLLEGTYGAEVQETWKVTRLP